MSQVNKQLLSELEIPRYKFDSKFVPLILAGQKTAAVRLPKENGAKPGKVFDLVNKETGDVLAYAICSSLISISLRIITNKGRLLRYSWEVGSDFDKEYGTGPVGLEALAKRCGHKSRQRMDENIVDYIQSEHSGPNCAVLKHTLDVIGWKELAPPVTDWTAFAMGERLL